MKALNLQVKEPGDVVLPAELAICGLTPIEIGSIFVMYAAATGTLDPHHPALDNDDVQLSLAKLRRDGIIQVDVDMETGKFNIDIDITKVK